LHAAEQTVLTQCAGYTVGNYVQGICLSHACTVHTLCWNDWIHRKLFWLHSNLLADTEHHWETKKDKVHSVALNRTRWQRKNKDEV